MNSFDRFIQNTEYDISLNSVMVTAIPWCPSYKLIAVVPLKSMVNTRDEI